jgi:peptidoglycan/LPS O-acetylase OafA/YrhL
MFRVNGEMDREISMNTAHTEPDIVKSKLSGRNGCTAFHRPELDILRFGAFLMVFLVHGVGNIPVWNTLPKHYKPIGGRGVDLFFVLSAYLITSILLREQNTSGAIKILNFYIRRILRIWPLYFAFLLLLAPHFLPQRNTRDTLAMFFFLGNWFALFHGITPGHLWSLSMEEQFYAAWPIVMRVSKKWAITVCVTLLLAGIALRWSLIHFHLFHSQRQMLNKWTFSRIDGIPFGALLAFMGVPRLSRTAAWALLFAGAFAVAFAGPLVPEALQLTLAAAGCAALLVSFLSLEFRNRYLEYLGKISFGLYIFHPVVLDVARTLIPHETLAQWLVGTSAAFVFTVVAAAASYRWFEWPFLRLKDRYAVIRRGSSNQDAKTQSIERKSGASLGHYQTSPNLLK